MQQDKGFITISRRILEWKYHDSSSAGWLFITILLKANWKTGYFKGQEIPRGTLITSVRKLSEDTGLALNTIRKWLKIFEKENMIKTSYIDKATKITVLNYEKYQQRIDTVTDTPVDTVLDTVSDTVLEPNRTNKQSNKETNNNTYGHSASNDHKKEQSESWFVSFWSTYPKKVCKKNAHSKFLKVCTSEEKYNEIMDGLRRTVLRQAQYEGTTQYIPNPDTWLNGERWNDAEFVPKAKPTYKPIEISKPTYFQKGFEQKPTEKPNEELLAKVKEMQANMGG